MRVESHGGRFPGEFAEFDTQLDGLVLGREAFQEVIAEFVPSLHVVGEGVGLDTRRTVDVGAAPVGADGTHDVCFVPVRGDTVGRET